MKLIIALFFCYLSIAAVNSLGCKDQKGNDVDWFLAFKMPKSNDYFYLDPQSDAALAHAPDQLDDTGSSPVLYTLK